MQHTLVIEIDAEPVEVLKLLDRFVEQAALLGTVSLAAATTRGYHAAGGRLARTGEIG